MTKRFMLSYVKKNVLKKYYYNLRVYSKKEEVSGIVGFNFNIKNSFYINYNIKKYLRKRKQYRVLFLKQLKFLSKNKRQKICFLKYYRFLLRGRLHINFRYYFSSFYKNSVRNLRKKKYKKKAKYLKKRVFCKTSNFKYYKKNFLEQRNRNKWKYFFKTRFSVLNSGFRFRQMFLSNISRMRYFFRYYAYYKPKRFSLKDKFKFYINFRRKSLKYEIRKNKLLEYNVYHNFNNNSVKLFFTKYKIREGCFTKRVKQYNILKRRQKKFLRTFYKKKKINKKYLFFGFKKPYWFRKGFRQWRLL